MTDTFTVKTWDEKIVSGPEDGPRYAHAHCTFDYSGTIRGTSSCDYLLFYDAGGADAKAPGIERIEGSVDGRKGSFLIRHEVAYGDSTGVHGAFTVVPSSGTGELAGITGTGTISGASETMNYTFEYRI